MRDQTAVHPPPSKVARARRLAASLSLGAAVAALLSVTVFGSGAPTRRESAVTGSFSTCRQALAAHQVRVNALEVELLSARGDRVIWWKAYPSHSTTFRVVASPGSYLLTVMAATRQPRIFYLQAPRAYEVTVVAGQTSRLHSPLTCALITNVGEIS